MPRPLLQVRVVKQQQLQTIAAMLGALFSSHDSAETIRQLCIGVSAHQKLDLLSGLVRLLGFESLAVFGDCFDEVRAERWRRPCGCDRLHGPRRPGSLWWLVWPALCMQLVGHATALPA